MTGPGRIAAASLTPRLFMSHQDIRFALSISREDYLRYYQGVARHVLVRSHDGRKVQFPARLLRPFVTHQGVRGEFRLVLDDANRMVDLQRL